MFVKLKLRWVRCQACIPWPQKLQNLSVQTDLLRQTSFWRWSSDELDVKLAFLTLFPGPKNFCSVEKNKFLKVIAQKSEMSSWPQKQVFEADSSVLWWVGRQKPDGVTSTFLVSCLHYWLMTTVAYCPFPATSAAWSPYKMLTRRHTWEHTSWSVHPDLMVDRFFSGTKFAEVPWLQSYLSCLMKWWRLKYTNSLFTSIHVPSHHVTILWTLIWNLIWQPFLFFGQIIRF